jgi:hypothetical protein
MAWRKQAAAIWREIRHLIAQLTPQWLRSFMGKFRQEIVPSSVASGLPREYAPHWQSRSAVAVP